MIILYVLSFIVFANGMPKPKAIFYEGEVCPYVTFQEINDNLINLMKNYSLSKDGSSLAFLEVGINGEDVYYKGQDLNYHSLLEVIEKLKTNRNNDNMFLTTVLEKYFNICYSNLLNKKVGLTDQLILDYDKLSFVKGVINCQQECYAGLILDRELETRALKLKKAKIEFNKDGTAEIKGKIASYDNGKEIREVETVIGKATYHPEFNHKKHILRGDYAIRIIDYFGGESEGGYYKRFEEIGERESVGKPYLKFGFPIVWYIIINLFGELELGCVTPSKETKFAERSAIKIKDGKTYATLTNANDPNYECSIETENVEVISYPKAEAKEFEKLKKTLASWTESNKVDLEWSKKNTMIKGKNLQILDIAASNLKEIKNAISV